MCAQNLEVEESSTEHVTSIGKQPKDSPQKSESPLDGLKPAENENEAKKSSENEDKSVETKQGDDKGAENQKVTKSDKQDSPDKIEVKDEDKSSDTSGDKDKPDKETIKVSAEVKSDETEGKPENGKSEVTAEVKPKADLKHEGDSTTDSMSEGAPEELKAAVEDIMFGSPEESQLKDQASVALTLSEKHRKDDKRKDDHMNVEEGKGTKMTDSKVMEESSNTKEAEDIWMQVQETTMSEQKSEEHGKEDKDIDEPVKLQKKKDTKMLDDKTVDKTMEEGKDANDTNKKEEASPGKKQVSALVAFSGAPCIEYLSDYFLIIIKFCMLFGVFFSLSIFLNYVLILTFSSAFLNQGK